MICHAVELFHGRLVLQIVNKINETTPGAQVPIKVGSSLVFAPRPVTDWSTYA